MSLILRRQEIEKGLSELGQSPVTLRHVYTTLNVSRHNIASLGQIEEFPFVQHLNVSENQLESLAPLSTLPNLLTLNASHNELTEALDYNVPVCEKGKEWAEGAGWIGSTLVKADLSYNKIPRLLDLSRHSYLRELVLDHNQISTLTGLSTLKHLRYLSLAHNQLESTAGLIGLNLCHLVLHHNNISDLVDLPSLPRLMKLDLRHNSISKLSILADCRQIQQLLLDHNPIVDGTELNHLIPLRLLATLTLHNTPVSKEMYYRPSALVRLNGITNLDGIVASAKERVSAANMFGHDLEARKEIFFKYIPNEPFVNHVPPLLLEETSSHALNPTTAEGPIPALSRSFTHKALALGIIKTQSRDLVNDVLSSMKSRHKF